MKSQIDSNEKRYISARPIFATQYKDNTVEILDLVPRSLYIPQEDAIRIPQSISYSQHMMLYNNGDQYLVNDPSTGEEWRVVSGDFFRKRYIAADDYYLVKEIMELCRYITKTETEYKDDNQYIPRH